MHIIANVKINCRIEVQFGQIRGIPRMIWVDGYIKSCDADGGVWVFIPTADQLYLCKPEEVFANLADVREMVNATTL
jgi:hypothetical protein